MKTENLLIVGGIVLAWFYFKGPKKAQALTTTDPNQVGGHTIRASSGNTLPPAPIDSVLLNKPMAASGGAVYATFKYAPQSFGRTRQADSPMFPQPINSTPTTGGTRGPSVAAGSSNAGDFQFAP